MKIIKSTFVEKNENTDKDYSIRIVGGENFYFVFINNDQRVKFNTLDEAEARFNELVNHVSPKPERRCNPAAFDKKTAWLEDKIFAHAEKYQF